MGSKDRMGRELSLFLGGFSRSRDRLLSEHDKHKNPEEAEHGRRDKETLPIVPLGSQVVVASNPSANLV
jgi:hypothetical protein